MVLLTLDSDAACTSLNGRSGRKSAVLVLVWCYKATGDREQDFWRYWLPQQEVWAGGAMKQWHCCIS